MNQTIPQPSAQTLQMAIRLAQDTKTQPQAHAAFDEVYKAVRTDNPQVAMLLQTLWREYVTTQRSAEFWQELCQVEKHLSERIAESHIQLKQNYLRLMQEQ